MSGEGKYTFYAPPATDQHTLLNKLFKSNDAVVRSPVQDLVGKEIEARAAITELGKQYLQPAHQVGDMSYLPEGVDLDFRNAPELSAVKWTNAGDPANAYVPDITSPGPGRTAGADKDVDPKISVTDIKHNVDPALLGKIGSQDTVSPAATSAKLAAASLLGVAGVDGDSGANK